MNAVTLTQALAAIDDPVLFLIAKATGAIREERTYGSDPERTPPDTGDISSMIDREIEIAKARWGETFELKCLVGSRGHTLSDEDILRMLRYFRDHGTVYSRVLAHVEAD